MGVGASVRKREMRYVDIHSHVIWGVDDGAQREEETYRMLREAAADSISDIICTPHVIPGIKSFNEERFNSNFMAAVEYIENNKLDLRLYKGAEVFFTDSTPRYIMEKRIATLAGSSFILVEFNNDASLSYIENSLEKIVTTGVRPVIAHVERYNRIRKAEQVAEIREKCNALVQVNARTIIGKPSFLRGKYIKDLFKNNLVDFIATDVHAIEGRQTCMTEGIEALKAKYGNDCCERICNNAMRLLE